MKKVPVNKISLRELSDAMFSVFNNTSFDMAYYQAMFNGLIPEMHFRFKDLADLRDDVCIDVMNRFDNEPEEGFYDAMNVGNLTADKLYSIVQVFIEPLKVEEKYVTSLPKSVV